MLQTHLTFHYSVVLKNQWKNLRVYWANKVYLPIKITIPCLSLLWFKVVIASLGRWLLSGFGSLHRDFWYKKKAILWKNQPQVILVWINGIFSKTDLLSISRKSTNDNSYSSCLGIFLDNSDSQHKRSHLMPSDGVFAICSMSFDGGIVKPEG